MRKIFLTVIVIVSSLNLTGCGEGGPDMAQVGQAVTQIAGLVGKMQGAAGGGNNGGVRQAEAPAPMRAEAPQRMPAVAPAAAQMPAPNIRPQQNVQTPAMVPVQNTPVPQVETNENTREPQTETVNKTLSNSPQMSPINAPDKETGLSLLLSCCVCLFISLSIPLSLFRRFSVCLHLSVTSFFSLCVYISH